MRTFGKSETLFYDESLRKFQTLVGKKRINILKGKKKYKINIRIKKQQRAILKRELSKEIGY
jgi:hypothetical protein